VAVGHNIGIEWAKGQGFSHVLLLDQDSVPAPDMVKLLLDVASKAGDRGERVCAVGPHYFDPVTGYASFFIRFGRLRLQRIHCYTQTGQQPVPVDFLISSGALIPMEALRIVGNMDEGLFVDHVDTEWFLRARSKGFNAYGVCQAQMRHSLGNDTVKIWLGRWYHVPIHSPLRHYYVFRNSAVLYQRNYVPLQWILNDAVRLVSMFAFYSLVTPPRFQHFIMMLKGFWDGLHGRHGRYETERKTREEAT
jgi:rhamnosyltransferase